MIRRYASAGAVVTTGNLKAPQFLLLDQVRTTGERQTVAPKGRLEPGEAPLQAAQREVAEEAGLADTHYSGYLGQEAYTFTDNDGAPAVKTVDWFLFTATTTATTPARDEGFVEARWLDSPAARQAATHAQFQQVLDRALAVIAWRAARPLPFSQDLSHLVTQVAADAQAVLAGYPEAGVGLCGSAARGDFVDDWSDVDFVAWNLPTGSPAATKLDETIANVSRRYSQRTSLHFADAHGRDTRRLGDLYDMKMRAVLRRVGLDTAVIAGVAPTPTVTADATNLARDIAALREFALVRLAASRDPASGRQDTARRVLSALSSAARLLVTHRDPHAPLRLPEVAETLRDWPGGQLSMLLGDYDAYRRAGAGDIEQAERLAARVPNALMAAQRLVEDDSMQP
ncbi:NUDIX domain-containing protein [Micromonospora craterilacus]|uniref:NUDIX domain-containing protein n=1 Tax=Micromonospora craterilacus TaxID=1655439 RepID=A0A2W2DSU6_9ACTN|nr:NUDIX domain-containing protein [Micromonospora craterilacus]PZG15062.1 NUDIX domain-containing protein [Micromonospora craterilacus]